ncbi:MAG: phenylacetate--CoA ligase family protein [bacterium]|nr:phenylacetate--CoA ligase family protein [bacterium]
MEGIRERLRRKMLLGLLKLKALSPEDMAEYARRNTLFHRSLYGDKRVSDFKQLPLVTKAMTRDASPYDRLSSELKNKVIWYAETTGSTGSPTPVFYTKQEFNGAYLLSLLSPYNAPLKAMLKENRTCLNGLALEFTIAGASFADMLVKNGGLVINAGSRSTIGPPTRIADAIVRLKPSIIAGAPLDFLCWMRIIKEDYPKEYDNVVDNLKILLSTAELCSDSRVAQIQKEFGIAHINTYACVEGFFTLTCPCKEKHILPAYYVELFDENLNLIGEYGKGRICITNLLKKSTPFVRYLLDDLVVISPSTCPYGFKKSVIPKGRYELSVKINDELYNVDCFEEIIFKYGLFGDYNLYLFDDRIELELEEYGKMCLEGLEEEFQRSFNLPTKIKIQNFGKLTAYRQVRVSKPILKLTDKRASSTQKIPDVL